MEGLIPVRTDMRQDDKERMGMHNNAIVIFITAGSMNDGEKIARALVEDRLAACCNIIPGIQSIYRWKGQVNQDQEVLLIVKSVVERIEDIKKRVRELHAYEVPELIVLTISDGLQDYLQWIEKETAPGC